MKKFFIIYFLITSLGFPIAIWQDRKEITVANMVAFAVLGPVMLPIILVLHAIYSPIKWPGK